MFWYTKLFHWETTNSLSEDSKLQPTVPYQPRWNISTPTLSLT